MNQHVKTFSNFRRGHVVSYKWSDTTFTKTLQFAWENDGLVFLIFEENIFHVYILNYTILMWNFSVDFK